MAYKEVSIWWRIARFTSDSGQFLQAEITYGTYPSSILSTYESCGNFLCWETEWESAPVTRTAAEAASINQLMIERKYGAVAANERSESATPLLGHKVTQTTESATGLSGSRPELLIFDDVEESQQEAYKDSQNYRSSAISKSLVKKIVDSQIDKILQRIDAARSSFFVIEWSSSTSVPLVYVCDRFTGQGGYGQADNFCEVYDVISPEMLYFYSTADEEF